MNNNKVFSLDIETSGLNVLNPNFKIFSMAVAYTEGDYSNIETRYFDNMEDIENALIHLQDKQVLVYNYGYEIYVFKHIFPHIKLNNVVDVMRLSQIKGLPPETKKDQQKFSLKATTKRFLPFYSGYEEKFYEWLRVNKGVKRGKEGAYLCELPPEMLREYNTLDSIVTLKLYFYFQATFAEEGYDWTIDHDLYKLIADYVIEGELNGIRVNREQLQEYVAEIEDEVATIDSKFRFKFKNEIEKVRERLRQKVQAKYKKKIVTELPEFNITSKQHLEMLVCDELGLKASITTPSGKPSFKSAHLSQYGQATALLEKRGKRLIAKSHCQGLLKVSELDGKFHPKLRIVGTKTGRTASASVKKEYGVSVNIQAISRNDKPLISSLIADEGYVLVESDGKKMEPTVIAALTGDTNYKLLNCDMIGKPPRFENGFLISDDVYVSFGSLVPSTRDIILQWVKSFGSFDSFVHAWLHKDRDEILKPIKTIRKLLKIAYLALGYGCQSKKLFKIFTENGFTLSHEDCETLFNVFWQMFPGVVKFNNYVQRVYKKQGYIYNPLGFRITTENYKVYNAIIQSSVNGCMSLYIKYLRETGLTFKSSTIIHDALLFQVLEKDIELVPKCIDIAVEKLNEDLQWPIKIGFGYNYGKDMYACK